jgi:hypothetical protein
VVSGRGERPRGELVSLRVATRVRRPAPRSR